MYSPLILTKATTFIIGPVASLLGYIMNGIFILLNSIGLPNIGLAIIIFTIVIYMCMLPLTIKQQRFSKLSNIMSPEIQAIQKKYKGKNDQESMQRMNEETQAVYRKYGVSATGSCLQLLIQMPILFALYRVIYNIPAYVTQVKDAFFPLVTNLINQAGASEYLQSTTAAAQFKSSFASENFINNVGNTVSNTFIDVLNRFSTADWSALSEQFPAVSGDVANTVSQLTRYNNFLGLNIGNSPFFTFREALAAGSVIGIIAAIVVPALAAVTQLINVALMPQPTRDDQENAMASSMKTMNYMMPIMSAWFCFTLPAGLGLYWVAGAVVRSVQQVLINKHINNMDMDAYLAKTAEKQKIAAEKGGDKPSLMQKLVNSSAAQTPSSSVGTGASAKTRVSDSEKQKKLEQAQNIYKNGKYKEGSLASKANMVDAFNNAKKNDKK